MKFSARKVSENPNPVIWTGWLLLKAIPGVGLVNLGFRVFAKENTIEALCSLMISTLACKFVR